MENLQGKSPEAPDFRIRTLAQSIDTARYHDDKAEDREADVSHARTEVLGALLFGYEMVIPAGAIADCPALIELVPEVLGRAEESLKEIEDTCYQPYHLFRIGLEPQYQSARSGYTNYVSEYISRVNEMMGGPVDFVQLQELAEEGRQTTDLLTLELGRAYTNRAWSDMDALGQKLSSVSGDEGIKDKIEGFKEYSRIIYNLLEQRGAFAYTDNRYFSDAPNQLYIDHLSKWYKDKENWYHSENGLVDLGPLFEDVYTRIVEEGGSPSERGSWYGKRKMFEDKGIWTFVRNWLDHVLFRRVRGAYDVHIPSYYTQESILGERSAHLNLPFVRDEEVESMFVGEEEDKLMQPAPIKSVDWKSIWEMVATKDYQERVLTMHTKCRGALKTERDECQAIQEDVRLSSSKKAERIQAVKSDRQKKVNNIISSHINFIESCSKEIEMTKNHLGVHVKVSDKSTADAAVKAGMKVVSNIVISQGNPVVAATGATLLTVTRATSKELSDKIDEIGDAIVNAVVRPPNADSKRRKQFFEYERKRVNYWIS